MAPLPSTYRHVNFCRIDSESTEGWRSAVDAERPKIKLTAVPVAEIPQGVAINDGPLSTIGDIAKGGSDLVCGACGWAFATNVRPQYLKINPPLYLRCAGCSLYLDLRDLSG